MASYEARIAERWGRTVRDDIRQHPNLGLTIRDDVSAQREWQLDGHDGGMFSTGVGGAMTGRPVDILLIDDPVKGREQADSPTIREKTWEWWTDTALSRLAPGAPVIIILTRWHSDDLAGRLIAEADSDWEFLNIPAQADHRPEKGETDVLDREPGEFMLSARGRTTNQWEARKKASGPKTWASLYQGRPSPDEGGVFPKDDEWARYDQPLWIEHPDGHRTVPGIHRDDQELVQSWDLTFKDTKSSDYVVGQVWLRVGTQAYLLDQVRERLNFTQTVAAITAMTAKWPEAVAKFIEDKANGPAVINALNRQVNGLIPIEPEGSKYARASAISPLVWSKDVILPEPHLLPNVTDLLEEAKHFPNSPTDDTVDALSQAINRILLLPILNGGFHQPDEYDLMDERGWTISPW
jgi:predicted phage terminase large subunit-like protein